MQDSENIEQKQTKRRKRKYFTTDGATPEGSLRDRVYHYLSDGMVSGALKPLNYLDQDKICHELAISKAPLRDALIRLEAEGFITIQPRRGVYINPTTLSFIRSAYQVIGALESDCIEEVFPRFTAKHVSALEESNEKQRIYLHCSDFRAYYAENIRFHDIFLSLSSNELLESILLPLRRRLYDFPHRAYSLEWENVHLADHQRFIDSIRRGNKEAAVSIFRHEHWSFAIHEKYISLYYPSECLDEDGSA